MAKHHILPASEQTTRREAQEQVSGHKRTRQRFFVPGPLVVDVMVRVDELAQQLAQVLRMQVGDELLLLDGSGLEFLCRLTSLERRTASVQILAAQQCHAEPHVHLTLYQCSLKQDKFEWVLQKGTELGVSRFVPVISERSIVRPAEALLRKYERWQAIVREAAEQCGRGRIPEISLPLTWEVAVAGAAGMRLLAWEGAQPAASLPVLVQQNLQPMAPISLAIGPEGGLSEDEAQAAVVKGWQLVSLGPRILRAETAALAAVVITMGLG